MAIPFDRNEINRAIRGSIVEEVREIGAGFARQIVFRTPVGMPETWKNPPPPGYKPGHARKNWRASIGRKLNDEVPGVDPGGGSTTAELFNVVRSYNNPRQALMFQNGVPYIRRLNAGWSRQAAPGFVELTEQAAVAVVRGGRKFI